MSSTDLDQESVKSTDRELTTENTSAEVTEDTKSVPSGESVFDNYTSEELAEKSKASDEELAEKQELQVDESSFRTDKVEEELPEEKPPEDSLVRFSTVEGDEVVEDEEKVEEQPLEETRSEEFEIDDVSIGDSFKELASEDITLEDKDLVSELGFRVVDEVDALDLTNFLGDKIEAEDGAAAVVEGARSTEDLKRKNVRISEDFAKNESFQFKFTPDTPLKMEELTSELEEDLEEEEDSRRLEDEKIDRAMYYQMYNMFNEQLRAEKMKNNFLQARLAGYYMRRKMLYVLREQTLHVAEMQAKYEKDLDSLELLSETSEREKAMNDDELRHLRQKRDTKLASVNRLFDKFHNGALEYGKTLTLDKTGKNNMDKMTERFLKRQKNLVTLLVDMRLKFIRLRNQTSEKVKALNALDNLGPGFRIMDFVQLKADNRDLKDKLEEKEGELCRLRKCCQNTMQILAHMREKTAAIDMEIQQLKEDWLEVIAEYEDAREQLHCLRRSRDEIRDGIKDLKLKFGLLVNKKALLDMEHSESELEELKAKLETVKADYNMKVNQVRAVRKNIEYLQEAKRVEEEKLKEEHVPVSPNV